MAGSVNKAILVGRLGRDPELRSTQGNTPVCNFSIATDENWKDQGGQNQTRTEWHKVVVWGRQAEIANQYLSKGRLVYVEGRIQTREYTDREGAKRYSTEIVARDIQFLGGQNDRSGLPGEGGGYDQQSSYGQQGSYGQQSAPASGYGNPAPAPAGNDYGAPAPAAAPPGPAAPPADDFTDDDIPF